MALWENRMTDSAWHTRKRELEVHLLQLVRAMEEAGEREAADQLRPLAFNPESHYETGSDWLGEVEFVSDIVLNRFPPGAARSAAVGEAKRLAQVALHGT